MKVSNITLVITDPCYIKHTWGATFINEPTIYGDWSCMCYKGDEKFAREKSKEWDAFYFDFWRKYNSPERTPSEQEALRKDFKEKKNKFVSENCYGEFCADSGKVAVFDYDKLDERDKQWIQEHKWCACIIPNYTGEFDYVVDGENNAHIVGKTFYTTQSGL